MISKRGIVAVTTTCSLLFTSCGKDIPFVPSVKEIIHTPEGFEEMQFPEDNQFTIERWELGKALFYDSVLSKSGNISCGSCHKPRLAFSDEIALSIGDESQPGRSNSPPLTNIGYHPYFTRAGGIPTLEMQVLVPIQEHDEFNNNMVYIVEVLRENPFYKKASQAAYSRELDAFVITRAIATFERSFISGNSTYDQFIHGKNPKEFGINELRGKELFFSSKTQCSSCHSGFNFTNYSFENNGLLEQYGDLDRYRITNEPSDIGKFKTPSLRNLSVTAPYMHDGSLNSIEEVIEHYNSGGYNHINKSEMIRPLNLSSQEKSDLVAFLRSLTDQEFLTNKNFY